MWHQKETQNVNRAISTNGGKPYESWRNKITLNKSLSCILTSVLPVLGMFQEKKE